MFWSKKKINKKSKNKHIDEIFSDTNVRVKLNVQDPLTVPIDEEIIENDKRIEEFAKTKVRDAVPNFSDLKASSVESEKEKIHIKGFNFDNDLNHINQDENINENDIFSNSADKNNEQSLSSDSEDDFEYIKVPDDIVLNQENYISSNDIRTTEEYIGDENSFSETKEFNISSSENKKSETLTSGIKDLEAFNAKKDNTDDVKVFSPKDAKQDTDKNNIFTGKLEDLLVENNSLSEESTADLPTVEVQALTFSQLVFNQYKIYQQIEKNEYKNLEKEKKQYKKSLNSSKISDNKNKNYVKKENLNEDFSEPKAKKHKHKKTSSSNRKEKTRELEYTKESDAQKIKSYLKQKSELYFIKTVILLFTTAFSFTVFLLEYIKPEMFDYPYAQLSLCVINLIFIAIININGFSIIKEGIINIFKNKTNYYSVIAIANVFVFLGGLLTLLDYKKYVIGSCNLYSLLLSALMLFFCWGKLFYNLSLIRNFNFVSNRKQKYCVKKFDNYVYKDKLANGLYLKNHDIVYQNKVDFIDGFIKNSSISFDNIKFTRNFTIICFLISLLVAAADFILHDNLISCINALSVLLCLCVPSYCLFIISFTSGSCIKKANKYGAMISGIMSARESSNCGAVIVNERDLFPKDSVKLVEIRSYDKKRTRYGIQYAFEILRQINHPLMDALKDEADPGYRLEVENIQIDDEGICAWVNNERVLIGSLSYMKRYYVFIPENEINQTNDETRTFVSLTGQLTFVISSVYRAESKTAEALQELEDNGYSIIVNTIDSNINGKQICNKFSLFYKSIKVLNRSLSEICIRLRNQIDTSYETSIATHGSFISLAKALCLSKRLNRSIKIMNGVQTVAVIISLIVSSVVILSAGISAAKCLELFIYMMFWFISALIINLFTKK